MMELADVTDSKSVVGNNVRVQVPPSAPAAKRAPARLVFFLAFKASKNQSNAKGIACLPYRQLEKEIM